MTTFAWDEEFERIVRRHLRLMPTSGALDPDADLRDLGLDSLTSVQLLVMLEDAYQLSVPDELLTNDMFATAKSLWTAIDALREPAAGRGATES